MPGILIGRLTSVVATWDIEPEEVNGFELVYLHDSTEPTEQHQIRGLETRPLRGGTE